MNPTKMSPNIFSTSLTENLSKFRIIKNLMVVSISFMFLTTGGAGLLMLQTTMNKEGMGMAALAADFVTWGFTSLIFSSFIVKKLGSRNSQILGIILFLPFIASNAYPMWITMLPSGMLRGVAKSLFWAAMSTYVNEMSVLYSKIGINQRKFSIKSKTPSICGDTYSTKNNLEVKSHEQKIKTLSAIDLLKKTEQTRSISLKENSTLTTKNSPVRLIAYKSEKDYPSKNLLYMPKNGTDTKMEDEVQDKKILSDSSTQNTASIERKEDVYPSKASIKIETTGESLKYRKNADSIKALFFGIHGLAYHSASVWSNLMSYYIIRRSDASNYNASSNSSCGVRYCSMDELNPKSTIEEVPDDTRQLLIGVCMASAIVAPILMILFLDRMGTTTKNVSFSWINALATIKYVKKKDQLLLIPYTIGASLGRGFYMADFTKSYIACTWSISHIGLITVVYGAASALSSLSSGVVIKYVGRKSVLVLCQIFTIVDFVFLYFWNPNAQQPYMFYVQGVILGMMSGIYNSQTKALYGAIFEGDEATAFSSYSFYSAIGWALPFIYGGFFCVSVKIYIVLAFSSIGLIGYLLAERRYSFKSKKTDFSNNASNQFQ